MARRARLGCCGLRSIEYGASGDRQTTLLAIVVLPEAILEIAHDSFVDILWNESTTVHDNV